jgi:hypothetical protein
MLLLEVLLLVKRKDIIKTLLSVMIEVQLVINVNIYLSILHSTY